MQWWAESFYNSKAWKKCRSSYKKTVDGLCERCYKKGDVVVGEIVHHKKYLTKHNINDPSITLSWSNLELLCRQCHGEEHGTEVTADGLYFNSCGDLVPIPPIKKTRIGELAP